MNNSKGQMSGQGTASAAANTVAIGPIDIESGICDAVLYAVTSSGTITTPTNPKLQFSPVKEGDVWGDVASGAVTVSSSASTGAHVVVQNILCKRLRVVTAGAFAAGDATVYLHGIEK